VRSQEGKGKRKESPETEEESGSKPAKKFSLAVSYQHPTGDTQESFHTSHESEPTLEVNRTAETTPEYVPPISEPSKGPIKPDASYAQLIDIAIQQSPDSKLTLSEIYAFIEDHFPYYQTAGESWRNSIRHILTLNPLFIKISRADHDKGRGSYWAIEPRKNKSRRPRVTLELLNQIRSMRTALEEGQVKVKEEEKDDRDDLLRSTQKPHRGGPRLDRPFRHDRYSPYIPIAHPLGGIAELRLPTRPGSARKPTANQGTIAREHTPPPGQRIPIVISPSRDFPYSSLMTLKTPKQDRVQTEQSTTRHYYTSLQDQQGQPLNVLPPLHTPIVPSQRRIIQDHYHYLFPDRTGQSHPGFYDRWPPALWPTPSSTGLDNETMVGRGLVQPHFTPERGQAPFPSSQERYEAKAESSRMAMAREEQLQDEFTKKDNDGRANSDQATSSQTEYDKKSEEDEEADDDFYLDYEQAYSTTPQSQSPARSDETWTTTTLTGSGDSDRAEDSKDAIPATD